MQTHAEPGKWTCCCCLSLTTGMIIVGVLLMLGAFIDLCVLNLGGAALNMLFAAPFIYAMMKPSDARRRKFVFIGYTVKVIFEMLAMFALAFFIGEFIDFGDYCEELDNGDYAVTYDGQVQYEFDSLHACTVYLNSCFTWSLVFFGVIGLLIEGFILLVLYQGYREQVEITKRRALQGHNADVQNQEQRALLNQGAPVAPQMAAPEPTAAYIVPGNQGQAPQAVYIVPANQIPTQINNNNSRVLLHC